MKSSQPENETRPWGHYDVLLQETFCKVKRIEVAPNSRLSYQTHSKREEVWVIVTGTGIITLNGNTQAYGPGAIVHIPTGTAHRIANPEKKPLVFIEIQRGEYFGEDDIHRIEDDYNRV